MQHVRYSKCERCRLNGLDCELVGGLVIHMRKIEDGLGQLLRHAKAEYKDCVGRAAENRVARDKIMAVFKRQDGV